MHTQLALEQWLAQKFWRLSSGSPRRWRVHAQRAHLPSRSKLEAKLKSWAGQELSAISVMKITMHTQLALEQWLAQKVESACATGALTFSLKDLNSIMLPEVPAGKGVNGRISCEQLKALVEATRHSSQQLRLHISMVLCFGAAPSAGACFWFSQCLPRGGRCDGCESRIYCVVLDMTLVQHPRLLWCSTPGYSMLMVQHPRLQHAYSTAPPRGATQCQAPSATSSVVQSKHPRLP